MIDDEEFFAKFSMASLLRGDQATRFAAYAVAIANGWMSQDDVRELEDLNPIPNGWGKNYWRPLNWAPLQQLTNPQPAKPAAADGDDEDDPDEDDEDGSGGDSGAKAATQARLQLMASGAADRCVRREVAGARKLVDREASFQDVSGFYVEQHRFVVEVFHFDPANSAYRQVGARQASLSSRHADRRR